MNYRVKLDGVAAQFFSFGAALAYSRRIVGDGFAVRAIINDDRTDGGKRQGLTEDEYLAALEVVS